MDVGCALGARQGDEVSELQIQHTIGHDRVDVQCLLEGREKRMLHHLS